MKLITHEQALHVIQQVKSLTPEQHAAVVTTIVSLHADYAFTASRSRPGETGSSDALWKTSGGLRALEELVDNFNRLRETPMDKLLTPPTEATGTAQENGQ